MNCAPASARGASRRIGWPGRSAVLVEISCSVSWSLVSYLFPIMKTFLSVLLAATLAGAAGYYFGHGGGATATVEKKPLFHQCPMHPWVKSDKPGNCTICGMALVPVFDSAGSFDKASAATR